MTDHQLSLLARIVAAMAETASMNAANAQRAARDESPAYTEEDFSVIAHEMGNLADALRG